MNETLRRAMFNARLDQEEVAARLGVDPKTVRRWLEGRVPYPRHRWSLADLVGVEEFELWPEVRAAHAARSRPDEVRAVYPHRWAVSRDAWYDLFESAESKIDVLAYSGLFLAEDAEILQLLKEKAAAGVGVRIALGDPDGAYVAERGTQEGIGESMAAKIRNALVLYRRACEGAGVQIRLHRTVLYNSIYRADDELLVNQHVYGFPAAQAPVFHLRRTGGGDMAKTYLDGFDRVWASGTPLDE